MTKETIIKSTLKYLVKRQIEEGSVGFAVDNDPDHDCCWDDVLAWIEAQPSEDAVSRGVLTEYINTMLTSNEEMASDATNEGRWVEEKTYLYGVEILEDLDEYVKTMPPVTPTSENIKEAYLKGYDYGVKDWFKSKTQPCEDCISRAEVRRVLSNEVFELMKLHTVNPEDNPKADAMAHGVNWSLNTLMGLPSVTPKYTDEEIDKIQAVEQAYVDKMVELAVEETKRPKGHWIIIDDCELFMAKCSECGEIVDSRMINKYPYCHCGAEMSGGSEDETDS